MICLELTKRKPGYVSKLRRTMQTQKRVLRSTIRKSSGGSPFHGYEAVHVAVPMGPSLQWAVSGRPLRAWSEHGGLRIAEGPHSRTGPQFNSWPFTRGPLSCTGHTSQRWPFPSLRDFNVCSHFSRAALQTYSGKPTSIGSIPRKFLPSFPLIESVRSIGFLGLPPECNVDTRVRAV